MHYADYKTILSPQNGMNLYRGCTHGCIYCDSRSTCYQMDHDFEDVAVKRNAPEILEEQLKRKRNKGMVVTGAMCDPYIPLEAELKLTRQCNEIICKYDFGLAILSKSNLMLRDLDIFKSINNKTKCVVQTTFTTYDEDLCKKLEPNVSTTKERFEVLEAMREEGIPTVVWLGPILPFINDSEENLRGILDYCVKAKVKGILCFGFGMTLREGNREYFYAQLDKLFPGMKERYIRSFGNSYGCDSPNQRNFKEILMELCKKHEIIWKPDDVFQYLNTYEKTEVQLSMF